MSFLIICQHDPHEGLDCPFHCDSRWEAKTLHQALTIKHAHISSHENHSVDVLDEEGIRIGLYLEGQ